MTATPTTPFPRLLSPALSPPAARPSFSSTVRAPSISISISYPLRGRRHRLAAFSKDTTSDKGQEQEPAPSAAEADGESDEGTEAEGPGEKSPDAVAAELKEVLRARKEAEATAGGEGWWAGVVQEMAEIEWPAPGKVVGTTGVVLGVIAGSTVALLSVNALLAELSDRVFAGRGLQDFFSG
ncbi:preprotein translocase subunit SECE1-like [Phragmites australis]|uniref:preprotein translocase subunit SECE1-like n=1 Tax=Phragmites australis TaxID=29695 RepID=UPI002D79FFDA|nr:preprotein translocase subunit SECE1-like [Phragmites australis]